MVPVSFGLAVPQMDFDNEPAGSVVSRLATRAERHGFSHLWVSELTEARALDPLHVLTFAAAATTTIRLGAAVIVLPLRIPWQLAVDTATLDQLSGGRLDLGIGFGSRPWILPRYGFHTGDRSTRYAVGLEELLRLWTGGPTRQGISEPSNGGAPVRPVQAPHPPLWFGAKKGAALRRAAERGHGWIAAGSSSLDELEASARQIRRHLAEIDRDPSTFHVAARVYLAVTNDKPATTRRLREWFQSSYGNPALAEAVAVVGNADEVAAGLTTRRRLGVTHLLLNPVLDVEEQVHALTDQVLPQLRADTTGG